MSRTILTRLVLVCTVAWASPAAADPITIASNGSGIAGLAYAGERGIDDLAQYPETPNGNNSFDLLAQVGGTTARGSASITSDLTDLSNLRATGATSASYETSVGQGEGHVSSFFFVFFELDRPHEFAFDADFVSSGDVIFTDEQNHRTDWHVTLLAMGQGGASSEVIAAVGNTSTTVARDGLLPAGLYRFLVSSTSFASNRLPQPASGSVFSNFSFSLALNDLEDQQPVPEPASLLLVMTGLGGMMMARRRQRLCAEGSVTATAPATPRPADFPPGRRITHAQRLTASTAPALRGHTLHPGDGCRLPRAGADIPGPRRVVR